MSDVAKAVTACGEAAREGARSLAGAPDEAIDRALRRMAGLLGEDFNAASPKAAPPLPIFGSDRKRVP